MRVLYFYNWGFFAPIACGADVVAANHLEYFRYRNWEVDCVIQSTGDRNRQEAAFRKAYPWLHSLSIIDVPGANFTFHELLAAYQQAAQSPKVRRIFGRPTDLFVTNYVFTAPLMEAVQSDCPRVLEAVDIISHSFALNEAMAEPGRDAWAAARDVFRFRVEMELYRLFDAVLFINQDEARLAFPHHPQHVWHVAPMCPTLGGGHTDEPSQVDVESCNVPYGLLFIGSDHPPNVAGVTWFYDNVFVPFLQQRRVKFAIAGNVCSRLNINDPHVRLLGRYEGALSELYAQARVVVIPLFHGSGLSIKTMECLGMGRAAVTTPIGARGIVESDDAYVRIDMQAEPEKTAERIVELLDNPEKRHAMQIAARDFFDRHFSARRYNATMDQVMRSIGLLDRSASGPTSARSA